MSGKLGDFIFIFFHLFLNELWPFFRHECRFWISISNCTHCTWNCSVLIIHILINVWGDKKKNYVRVCCAIKCTCMCWGGGSALFYIGNDDKINCSDNVTLDTCDSCLNSPKLLDRIVVKSAITLNCDACFLFFWFDTLFALLTE